MCLRSTRARIRRWFCEVWEVCGGDGIDLPQLKTLMSFAGEEGFNDAFDRCHHIVVESACGGRWWWIDAPKLWNVSLPKAFYFNEDLRVKSVGWWSVWGIDAGILIPKIRFVRSQEQNLAFERNYHYWGVCWKEGRGWRNKCQKEETALYGYNVRVLQCLWIKEKCENDCCAWYRSDLGKHDEDRQ